MFADEHATFYRIHPSRTHEVVVEVLREDFGEVLVSDCFLTYDPLPFAKQKCMAYLLRNCGEIKRAKSRVAVRFSRRAAALLLRGMALKLRKASLSSLGYVVARGRLDAEQYPADQAAAQAARPPAGVPRTRHGGRDERPGGA